VEDIPRKRDYGSTGEFIQLRSRWQYVKQRLRRRGVVEVAASHPRYDMLAALQTAVRMLLTEHPEAQAKVRLRISVTENLSNTLALTAGERVWTLCSTAPQ